MSTQNQFAALFCIALLALMATACSDNGAGTLSGDDDDPPASGGQATTDICDYDIPMGGDPYRCEGSSGFSGGSGSGGGGRIAAYCQHDLACYGEDSEEEFNYCVSDLEAFRTELVEDYGGSCGQAFDGLLNCALGLSCTELFDFEGCESEDLHFEETCSDTGGGGTTEPIDPLRQASIEVCEKHYECDMMSSAEHDDCIADVEFAEHETLEPQCESALINMYSCENALPCDQYEDWEERMAHCESESDQVSQYC